MKKILLFAVIGLMACTVNLNAQPPMGGGGGFPGGMGGGGGFPGGMGGGMPMMGGMGMGSTADNRTPEEKTDEVATKYGLDATQRQALLELNQAYSGKLQMEVDTTMMRRDFRSMTEEEREAMMEDMESRMGDMMDQFQEIAGNQEAYEDALKQIMTKKQYRKYRTDKEKDQLRAQRERERQFQAGGGFGGFPGGGPG